MKPKRRAHYVLSTHWDREWYQPFQEFRFRLVRLLDRVLSALEDGRLQGPFQTDGQSIILEDYLEIRPERRAQIASLARAGKLIIGPWYTVPDEFLVSGESLIRNLRLGRQQARDWGGTPSQAGFVADLFGHNSQMPQIFAGFGIKGGFIWRGTNLYGTANVLWRGADGTEMPCYRFGHSYTDYARSVRHTPDRTLMPQALHAFVKTEAARTQLSPLLLFDGADHLEWDEENYAVLGQNRDAHQDFEIIHSSLDAYLEEMLPQAARLETVLEGELREPAILSDKKCEQWLIPGVLSSRVPIKQANSRCQHGLCAWAEPMSAWANLALGLEYPQGFLDVAWKWLLQNHPHDSICGCSIDAVHRDVDYRFRQCEQIAARLTLEATRHLCAAVAGEIGPGELRLSLFNPLPQPFEGHPEITLQIPADWPHFNEFFGFEPQPGFRIFDSEGAEVPYQRLSQQMNQPVLRAPALNFPTASPMHEVRVCLPVQVPALGLATFCVRRGQAEIPTRHPQTPGLAVAGNVLENELLRVEAELNGTLTVLDKRSGQRFERLLMLEECADIGDGWYHGVAQNDRVFSSLGCASSVTLEHDGPQMATLGVRVVMPVPQEFRFDSMTRSPQLVDFVVEHLVTLRAGADWLEVETRVQNNADDHRVRVVFPSGAQTDSYLSDSAFDVVQRPIALRANNHEGRELEVETKPQQSWTAVFDQTRGLAVVADGLLESAVRDLPERPLALTLFRGTRRTVLTAGEPDGLLRGELKFRYRIVPLSGAPDYKRLFSHAARLSAGLRDVQLQAADLETLRRESTPALEVKLSPSQGFLNLEGEAVLSSARMVQGALEVRVFNPHSHGIEARLIAGFPVRGAQRVDFESQAQGELLPAQSGALNVLLNPKEIVTLRLEAAS